MELKRAKEVLEAGGAKSITGNCILFANEPDSFYLEVFRNGHTVINGFFTPDEYEAIATWMRDPEGVVKA